MREFRSCQYPMIEHIHALRRCAIYADVGLGKTSAVIKALDDLSVIEPVYPVLVCATLRVARDTWVDEVKEWGHFRHIRVVPIVGTVAERLAALTIPAEYYCTNYENIPWLVETLGDKWRFKTIVADESTKLRGFRIRQGTQRSHALYKKAWGTVTRFIELTGTPAPNGLQGLHGQIYFIDKGERLGRSFEAFKQRWFQQGWDGYSIKPLPHAQTEIQNKIRDICLTVDARDYFDLKAPIKNIVYVDLPKKVREFYRDMEKRMFADIEGTPIEAFNAASKTQKCLQICSGAIYTDDKKSWKELHNVKIEALESIIEEYNGMPIMTAYSFVHDKERLLKHFPKAVDLSTIKGLKIFKNGDAALGIAHPASLGHGIDGLQKVTNILAFFSHDWDLELFDQICGRIGPVRQMQAGLDRNVFHHFIVARNTLDEDVMERRESKRSVQDILLDAMKRSKHGDV